MLKSMTGFGSADGQYNQLNWRWEIRSVNGKGLDLKFRLPQRWDDLEVSCRKLGQSLLSRGNLQCALTLSNKDGKTELSLNADALEQAIDFVRKVEAIYETTPCKATDILALPGVISRETNDVDSEEQELFFKAQLMAFNTAIVSLLEARTQEGNELESALTRILSKIDELTQNARKLSSAQELQIKQRLGSNIEALLEQTDKLDPQRLSQEALILINKSDIREELDRLDAHIVAARVLMQMGSPMGRKFEFLAQEFNREANTLCSKSASIELTNVGLELKSNIEKLREQVLNVE